MKKEKKSIKRPPWLQKDGKPCSDGELRKRSKDWSPKTWESYLKATIDKQSHLEDTSPHYENLVETSV